jgi:AraC-like DNA-binding protein
MGTNTWEKSRDFDKLRGESLFENRITELLTLGELARQLKISISGLRKIIARDVKFPKYKVGQQLRFSWDAVERYFRKGDA